MTRPNRYYNTRSRHISHLPRIERNGLIRLSSYLAHKIEAGTPPTIENLAHVRVRHAEPFSKVLLLDRVVGEVRAELFHTHGFS